MKRIIINIKNPKDLQDFRIHVPGIAQNIIINEWVESWGDEKVFDMLNGGFITEHISNPKEFSEAMKDIVSDYRLDTEKIHGEMDMLMCNTLKMLGYSEGVSIFEKVKKWYS